MRYCILSFLLASSFLFSIQEDSLINLSKPHNQTSLIKNIHQTDTIIQPIDYKLLYDNQNIYIDRLTSTVQWSIATVLGIIVLVVGSNILVTYKFNREKYKVLAKSIENQFNGFQRNAIKFSLKKLDEISLECKSIISKTISEEIKLIDNQYSVQYSSFTKYIH